MNIGASATRASRTDPSVELSLGKDIKTEPFYLSELLIHSGMVREGIHELYQNKMIAAWSDLLGDLFLCFVEMHFSGRREFHELKKRTARLDFSVKTDLTAQIKAGLISDYAFQRYNDRVKIINDILNPDCKHERELLVIKKHVLIRNSIQHHASKVYREMLSDLGCSRLEVLDKNDDVRYLDLNERIILSIPELDLIKRVLFQVSNEWRKHCGEDPDGGNT